MDPILKLLAMIPLCISIGLWIHLLYVLRRISYPMWSGKYVPLKAVIVEDDSIKERYNFSYQEKEHHGFYICSDSSRKIGVGKTCYIYFNPKTESSFLGMFREVKILYIVIMVVRNCLPLIPYLFYYIIKFGVPIPNWSGFAILILIDLLFFLMVAYNFPRWRRYRHFAVSGRCMPVDAVVVEKRPVSATRDLLLYRSIEAEHPFTGEIKVVRHPVQYEVGDPLLVYYDSKTGKTFPQFAADKLRLASLGTFLGLFFAISIAVSIGELIF